MNMIKKYKVPDKIKEILIIDEIPYALLSTLEKQGEDWVLVYNQIALKEIKDEH